MLPNLAAHIVESGRWRPPSLRQGWQRKRRRRWPMRAQGLAAVFWAFPSTGRIRRLPRCGRNIKKLGGQLALLETGDWGEAAGGGQFVLKPERVGAEPPAALVELFKITREDVLSACGINPALLTDAQGTAMREAYRQFLFGTVSPLGRMVAAELSEKLNTTIRLDWEELRASDIAGRARAFGIMVGIGMETDRAAALSGLLAGD